MTTMLEESVVMQGTMLVQHLGEGSRNWSLGHAGDEGPHLAITGESRGFS